VDTESREGSWCLRVLAEASVEKQEEEKRGATRSEGVVVLQEDEVRGVADVKEHPAAERVSSLWAQTAALVTLALNKQGVRSRSSAAWPG
jgi:hypothetical protein